MVALGRHTGRTYVEQIRGPCNTEPPKATVATAVRWLRTQRPTHRETESGSAEQGLSAEPARADTSDRQAAFRGGAWVSRYALLQLHLAAVARPIR